MCDQVSVTTCDQVSVTTCDQASVTMCDQVSVTMCDQASVTMCDQAWKPRPQSYQVHRLHPALYSTPHLDYALTLLCPPTMTMPLSFSTPPP